MLPNAKGHLPGRNTRIKNRERIPGQVDPIVCARHGHNFMGCKSPVPYLKRGHIDNFKSTSRKQGVGG
jgi:hypothetical protein